VLRLMESRSSSRMPNFLCPSVQVSSRVPLIDTALLRRLSSRTRDGVEEMGTGASAVLDYVQIR
jgi:hypothetical protein